MPSLYNLRQKLQRQTVKRDGKFEPDRNVSWGTVFSIGGDIFVPNTNESRVWVYIMGVQELPTQAFRGDLLVQDGTPVKLTRYLKNPYLWQIVDIHTGTLDPFELNDVVLHTIGAHAPNHQIPTEALIGPDPVYIYQPAMKELRIEADGSTLDITVQRHVYWLTGAYVEFPGSVIDLTTSVPAANNSRKVLIYLDTADNTAKIVDGTEVLTALPIDPPYPELPSGGRAAGFVELDAAQTAIVQSTDIEHARDFLGQAQTVIVPAPTANGHILIGDEGSWISVLPMVDEDGNIMTDEDSQIMWDG